MSEQRLFVVLLVATLVNGVLAGLNLDRYIVQVPAFRRMPMEHWAAYARLADLRSGLVWYPLLAATSLVSILIADWFYITDPGAQAPLTRPLALATMFVMGGVVTTIGAAPTLLRLRRTTPTDTGRVFFRFHRWGLVRAACQTLAFPATLWALVTLPCAFTPCGAAV